MEKEMPERDYPASNAPSNYDVEKGLNSVQRILDSTDEQFRSRSFILERIRQFGLINRDWPELSAYTNWKNGSEFGLIQIPTEFADFSMDMSTLGIKSAVEIGVYTGASAYFLAAMLSRAQRDLEYHMVDIADNVVEFDEFKARLNLVCHIPATSGNLTGRSFDLVFIDGDHSYQGVLADLANVGRYCNKAVAFHDIRDHQYDHLSGGTVRMWNEFRHASAREMKISQYTHEVASWMGIGVGIRAA